MRLIRFRVKDFRSVVDSDWIEVERVTALIGVNESGKTNLLLPLWKLNPAREGEIRPTSDYPKAYFGAVRENPDRYDFILAEFEVPPELVAQLASMTGIEPKNLDRVQVGRDYDSNTLVRFPKHVVLKEAESQDVLEHIANVRNDIAGTTSLQKETSLHSTFVATLDQVSREVGLKEKIDANDVERMVATLTAILPGSAAPTSTIVPKMKLLIEELQAVEQGLKRPPPEEVEGVHKLVWDNVPRFVYYSNYGNLDSEIYLPHVVENLKRTDLGAKEAAKARTLRVLFKFVRLEPEEILELGRDFQDTN